MPGKSWTLNILVRSTLISGTMLITPSNRTLHLIHFLLIFFTFALVWRKMDFFCKKIGEKMHKKSRFSLSRYEITFSYCFSLLPLYEETSLKKSGKKVKFFTKFTKIYNFILPHVYTFLIFKIRFHLIMAYFNFLKKKEKQQQN